MLIKRELKKRILTSIILIVLAPLCILTNKILFFATLLVVSTICFYEWLNINKLRFKKKKKNVNLIKILGLIYIIIFYYSSVTIYTETSKFFLIYIILVCASSDIGGYIFGKIIGGVKLTKISPNKTISGSIGSFLFCIIPLFFIYKTNLYLDLDFSTYNIIFCLIVSLSCQIGDLIISYFKRLNKVKDTGKILPGHGGLLDRIDGIIFAIPFALLLLKVWFY